MVQHSQVGGRRGSARWCGALLAAAGALAAARPARAQLEICNNSAETISLAVAYRSDGDWVSRGWYNIDAGYCKNVVGGPLDRRYYYIRGEGTNGNVWSGSDIFCIIHGSAFTIRGDSDCADRGYSPQGFIELDTGSYSHFRHNLTG